MSDSPRTPAGKRLWRDGPWHDSILAIEAEAARQERERLRPLVMALADFLPVGFGMPDSPAYEAWVAVYDALLAEPEETP